MKMFYAGSTIGIIDSCGILNRKTVDYSPYIRLRLRLVNFLQLKTIYNSYCRSCIIIFKLAVNIRHLNLYLNK